MQQKVEAKKGNRWYPEDDVMKVDPKALGLATWRDQLADFFGGVGLQKKDDMMEEFLEAHVEGSILCHN